MREGTKWPSGEKHSGWKKTGQCKGPGAEAHLEEQKEASVPAVGESEKSREETPLHHYRDWEAIVRTLTFILSKSKFLSKGST